MRTTRCKNRAEGAKSRRVHQTSREDAVHRLANPYFLRTSFFRNATTSEQRSWIASLLSVVAIAVSAWSVERGLAARRNATTEQIITKTYETFGEINDRQLNNWEQSHL